jgi:hypothetical protein
VSVAILLFWWVLKIIALVCEKILLLLNDRLSSSVLTPIIIYFIELNRESALPQAKIIGGGCGIYSVKISCVQSAKESKKIN